MSEEAIRPKFNSANIRDVLRKYDRTPFIDVLADWLEVMPEKEKIREWAEKKPYLYMQSLATLAKISGFGDKNEVMHHHVLDLTKMSDVEIERRVMEITERMSLPAPSAQEAQEPDEGVIDGELVVD